MIWKPLALLLCLLGMALSAQAQNFGVYRQLWTGLDQNINSLDRLTNTTYNPGWPDTPVASYTKIFAAFETEINSGMSGYGERLRTYVVPPMTGNYTFWISSDDASTLFLSSDESPVNSRVIAWVSGWSNSREWTKESNQRSGVIPLEAGRRYYMEAIMKQGGGGDNCAVRWQLPNGLIEEPLITGSIAGTMLIPFTGLNTTPAIYQQPTNTTVYEGRNASFFVLATNQAPLTYQWRLNGVNLTDANATKPLYTITNVHVNPNNGQSYSCVVSSPAGSVPSASAILTFLLPTYSTCTTMR